MRDSIHLNEWERQDFESREDDYEKDEECVMRWEFSKDWDWSVDCERDSNRRDFEGYEEDWEEFSKHNSMHEIHLKMKDYW